MNDWLVNWFALTNLYCSLSFRVCKCNLFSCIMYHVPCALGLRGSSDDSLHFWCNWKVKCRWDLKWFQWLQFNYFLNGCFFFLFLRFRLRFRLLRFRVSFSIFARDIKLRASDGIVFVWLFVYFRHTHVHQIWFSDCIQLTEMVFYCCCFFLSFGSVLFCFVLIRFVSGFSFLLFNFSCWIF